MLRPTPLTSAPAAKPAVGAAPQPQAYLNLKAYFHRRLIDTLNLEAIEQLDRQLVEAEIRSTILQYLSEEQTPLSELLKFLTRAGPARALGLAGAEVCRDVQRATGPAPGARVVA